MTTFDYRSLARYKYQLLEGYDYTIPPGFFRGEIGTLIMQTTDAWVVLTPQPHSILLSIKRGYCWDGPSGPTIDTENFMRGSLVHDALYQLFREISALRVYRDDADRILERICIEDGMSTFRASLVYWGVKTWGARSAGEESEPPKFTRPDP